MSFVVPRHAPTGTAGVREQKKQGIAAVPEQASVTGSPTARRVRRQGSKASRRDRLELRLSGK